MNPLPEKPKPHQPGSCLPAGENKPQQGDGLPPVEVRNPGPAACHHQQEVTLSQAVKEHPSAAVRQAPAEGSSSAAAKASRHPVESSRSAAVSQTPAAENRSAAAAEQAAAKFLLTRTKSR